MVRAWDQWAGAVAFDSRLARNADFPYTEPHKSASRPTRSSDMSTTAEAALAVRWTAQRTILVAGLTAGLLDILYAITVWAIRGVPPMRILQSVAGGLLGRDAFTGGVPTALLGTFLHFFISCCAAAFFYYASRRMRLLLDRPVLSGFVFGLGMYVVMNYVVLPLSASPGGGGNLRLDWMFVGALFTHTVFFGLPIALLTRRGVLGSATR